MTEPIPAMIVRALQDFQLIEIPYPDGHGTASIQLRHTVDRCMADVAQIDGEPSLTDLMTYATEHQTECDLAAEAEDWRYRGTTLLEGQEETFGWRLAYDGEDRDAEPLNGVSEKTATYGVWWTDYVANEWPEEYPTFSTALARLALLLECSESEAHPEGRWFAHTSAEQWQAAWDLAVTARFTEGPPNGIAPYKPRRAPGPWCSEHGTHRPCPGCPSDDHAGLGCKQAGH